jgi:hypothetical protein
MSNASPNVSNKEGGIEIEYIIKFKALHSGKGRTLQSTKPVIL